MSDVAERGTPSPATAELASAIAEARTVAGAREQDDALTAADRWTALALGGGFLAACVAILTRLDGVTGAVVVMLALLTLAHVLGSRVVFESAAGSAVATQPVFVAALFLLPRELVPLVVLGGLLGGRRESWRSPRLHHVLVSALSGWNSLGPIAVLGLCHATEARLADWPVYVLALLAQFAIDALVAVVRCRALDISWRVLPRPMVWMYGVDALLAPIGLMAVLAAEASRWSVLLAITPVGVLALLARDRAASLEKAVVISEAFGDAMEIARTDPLTQLGNRRAWNESIANAALRFAADPEHVAVTVVMADLDGLKLVNDTHGHEAGDEMIRSAARAFRAAAPTGALVARLGGDELGMLIVSDAAAPHEVVGSIRAAIAAEPAVRGALLSMSVGAASCPPYDSVESASVAADERALAEKSERHRTQRHLGGIRLTGAERPAS